MKKFINDVENVESEMLDGMCLAEQIGRAHV